MHYSRLYVVTLAPKVVNELCHAVLESKIIEDSLSEYNIYTEMERSADFLAEWEH